ncbi:hypothetical protein ACI797_03655 [Geodermatophilus sp. SYSU D00691]
MMEGWYVGDHATGRTWSGVGGPPRREARGELREEQYRPPPASPWDTGARTR